MKEGGFFFRKEDSGPSLEDSASSANGIHLLIRFCKHYIFFSFFYLKNTKKKMTTLKTRKMAIRGRRKMNEQHEWTMKQERRKTATGEMRKTGLTVTCSSKRKRILLYTRTAKLDSGKGSGPGGQEVTHKGQPQTVPTGKIDTPIQRNVKKIIFTLFL